MSNEPTAVKAAESFQAQLASASEAQILAMAKRWQGVESNLTVAIEDLAEEIASLTEAGEAVPAWKLFQMKRYQSLIAQIGGELSKYMNWAIVQMGDDAKKAQALARSHAAEMLSIQGDGKTGVLETALDKLQAGAAEKITALAQAGNPLETILRTAYPTAVNAITDKLVSGAALGWNPKKTVREILRGGGLDQALNHIMLVSRDQQIRNYRETQREAYKASSVVYGYMRLARKAKRTCMACLALDGTIYPKGEVMQLHPQDRCSMIPLVVGRPVPSWQTGLEWFKKQSPSEQRGMLGVSRYKMWKDGVFELEQIVTVKENPTWGPSAQVTSAKALKAGSGGVRGDVVTSEELLRLHTAGQGSDSQAKTKSVPTTRPEFPDPQFKRVTIGINGRSPEIAGYVNQLVETVDFSADDIYGQIKKIYPKTNLTAYDIKVSFWENGVIEPGTISPLGRKASLPPSPRSSDVKYIIMLANTGRHSVEEIKKQVDFYFPSAGYSMEEIVSLISFNDIDVSELPG